MASGGWFLCVFTPARGDQPYPDPYSSNGGLTGNPTRRYPGTRVGWIVAGVLVQGLRKLFGSRLNPARRRNLFPARGGRRCMGLTGRGKNRSTPSIIATITLSLQMKPLALTRSRGILPFLPDASPNALLTHRVRYGINSARTPGAWCSWLTRGPVKAETAGSNPVAPARCTTRRSCTFF